MKTEKRSLEETLVFGSQGRFTTDTMSKNKPLVVRGVIRKDDVDQCIRDGRDFYYIDTGYLGNLKSIGNPGGKKIWHRVVRNANQHSYIRDVPADRYNALKEQDPRLEFTGWKNYDKKILLVMPNPKACKYYNVNYEKWVNDTHDQIAKYIDLPVEVRIKGSRSSRNNEKSIYTEFDSGVYATIALNSIAAVESVLYGIPAFVTVPCAATPLASTDLSQLSNPFKPDKSTIIAQARNLAYGQFNLSEIESGYANKIIEKFEQ